MWQSVPIQTFLFLNSPLVETDASKIERVMGEVGIENSLKASTVKNAYEKLWKAIRFYMNHESMPRIIVRNFGTFEPSLTQMEKGIKKLKEFEIEGKDIKDKEKAGRLEKVKERVTKETKARGHGPKEDGRNSSGESGEVSSTNGDLGDLS